MHFGDILRIFGIDPHRLGSQMTMRKLQLVYVHWSIMLLFLLVTIFAVGVLIRRRRDLSRAIPRWIIPVLGAYCLLVGLFFFNRGFFSHAMLAWGWYECLPSMLWSLAAAVVPVGCLYLTPDPDPREWRKRATVRLALIPVMHSVMTFIYVSWGLRAVE